MSRARNFARLTFALLLLAGAWWSADQAAQDDAADRAAFKVMRP